MMELMGGAKLMDDRIRCAGRTGPDDGVAGCPRKRELMTRIPAAIGRSSVQSGDHAAVI